MKMTITVTDDMYWKFQEAVAQRRRVQEDAVEEALREGIRGFPEQLWRAPAFGVPLCGDGRNAVVASGALRDRQPVAYDVGGWSAGGLNASSIFCRFATANWSTPTSQRAHLLSGAGTVWSAKAAMFQRTSVPAISCQWIVI